MLYAARVLQNSLKTRKENFVKIQVKERLAFTSMIYELFEIFCSGLLMHGK